MSLIMDALKKAQQLRLKESKGAPFFNAPNLKGGKGQKGKKYFWIFAIAGSGALLLLFFLGSSLLPLLTSHQRQKVVSVEKKEPLINIGTNNHVEESTQRNLKISNPPIPPLEKGGEGGFDKSIFGANNKFKEPHKGEVSSLQREKPLLSMKSSTEERREEPQVEQSVNQEKIVEDKIHKKAVTEKELRTHAPGYQKKETLSTKPNDSENVGEKDRAIASDVLTYFNMGVDFYRQREISKAIHAYQKVIELDPAYVEAYNNMGIIYQGLGDFDKALEAYQTSIKINPRYEKAYNNLGVILFLSGRYEESKEAFQNALDINQNNIESYINIGILYKKQGQFEKAIGYYQKALTINPLHGETHYNIGLLYEELENPKMAIIHYQKFIQLSSRTHPDLVSKVQRHLDYLLAIKGVK